MSLEASVISSRPDVNRIFYGMDVKPSSLLSGAIPRPRGAEPLYKGLVIISSVIIIFLYFTHLHMDCLLQHYQKYLLPRKLWD